MAPTGQRVVHRGAEVSSTERNPAWMQEAIGVRESSQGSLSGGIRREPVHRYQPAEEDNERLFDSFVSLSRRC